MVGKNKEYLPAEVESRLDELFDENVGTPAPVEDGSATEVVPLRELRAVVLSIDWEITEAAMTSLIRHIDELNTIYRDEKIPLMFLQLLRSLGKYIRRYKSKAHVNAVKLLNSAFMNFEKVVLSKDLSETERRQLLSAEILKFKQLKEQVAPGSTAAKKKKAVNSPDENDSPANCIPPQEAVLHALNEIKQMIQAEFQALRAELRSTTGGK